MDINLNIFHISSHFFSETYVIEKYLYVRKVSNNLLNRTKKHDGCWDLYAKKLKCDNQRLLKNFGRHSAITYSISASLLP